MPEAVVAVFGQVSPLRVVVDERDAELLEVVPASRRPTPLAGPLNRGGG